MWVGSGKVVPYRAEAIVAFPSDWAGERLLGRELLRGAVQAPRVWRPQGNWQRWYRVVFEQILPVHVLRCSGLVFINFFSDQILDPMIQGLVRRCPFRDRVYWSGSNGRREPDVSPGPGAFFKDYETKGFRWRSMTWGRAPMVWAGGPWCRRIS